MEILPSTTNEPTFAYDDLPLYWQMSRAEKFAFARLLETAKPEVAIEIGTFKGGSLQIIAKAAEHAHSIDISEEHRPALRQRFSNVTFHTGQSRKLLPPLLSKLQSEGTHLGFVLIDGEHTMLGVRDDINAVLQYRPVRPVYIVFHDSFNPECREGILAADWAGSPYVHFVEVDFIPGVYHKDGFDEAPPRSMYGGLAVAVMLPEPRQGELIVHQSQKGIFDAIYAGSCHAANKRFLGLPARIRNKLRRLFS